MVDKNIWEGWEVSEQIGEDSFSKVYKMHKAENGKSRFAALKVVSIPKNNSVYDGFIAEGYTHDSITNMFKSQVDYITSECTLMRKLHGLENIISYDDFRVVPNKDTNGWDVMIQTELLSSLPDYYMRRNFDESAIIKLGTDICTALEHCEKFNVIHGNINPNNIFVNEAGNFKLGDLGLAYVPRNHAEDGSYAYTAPEVLKGGAATRGSDLYCLGMVLYWMLNGKRPAFESVEQAEKYHTGGVPLTPPKNGSPALKAAVMKALALNPNERFACAGEFKAALNKNKKPAAAPIISGAKSAAKIAEKKNKLRLFGIIALAALVLVGGVVAAVLLGSNDKSKRRSSKSRDESSESGESAEGSGGYGADSFEDGTSAESGESFGNTSIETDNSDYESLDTDISNSDAEYDSALIGPWYAEVEGETLTFVFEENGTGEMAAAGVSADLEWHVSDGKLTMDMSLGGMTENLVSDADYEIDGDSLTITYENVPITLTKGEPESDDNDAEKEYDGALLGTWSYAEDGTTFLVTFEENGKGTLETEDGMSASLDWYTKNGALSATATLFSSTAELFKDARYSVEGNELYLTVEGETVVLERNDADVDTGVLSYDSDLLGTWYTYIDGTEFMITFKEYGTGDAAFLPYDFYDLGWYVCEGKLTIHLLSPYSDEVLIYFAEDAEYSITGSTLTTAYEGEAVVFTKSTSPSVTPEGSEYGSSITVPYGKTNYALGCPYTISKNLVLMDPKAEPENIFLADSGSNNSFSDWGDVYAYKLTDGFTARGEDMTTAGSLEGVTVAFVGSNALYEFVIDLGEVKTDISSIVICGVRDGYANGNTRGFNKNTTMIYTSDYPGSFGGSLSTKFSSKELSNAPLILHGSDGSKNVENFTYTYTLNTPASGRYVKILLSSPVYVLQFDEIMVLN